MGGSSIDGALGSMLFEIMPFLRGIASDLSQRLGPDSQSLLPTVAAAFSLCSLLIGFVFTLMSIAKSGRLLEYIPRTVLTGAVGMSSRRVKRHFVDIGSRSHWSVALPHGP